ncbi:hypothetical protein C7212DRAFT_156069, partial [Tuber magnatum]
FQMKQDSFNHLLSLIYNSQTFMNNLHNCQTSLAVQLVITLYFLGFNGISTVYSAAQLGISEGTTRLYINRCISVLV